jgi:hypothetical protein
VSFNAILLFYCYVIVFLSYSPIPAYLKTYIPYICHTEMGFYGGEPWTGGEIALSEAGEALSVVDKTEAWMFHVLPDDTGILYIVCYCLLMLFS